MPQPKRNDGANTRGKHPTTGAQLTKSAVSPAEGNSNSQGGATAVTASSGAVLGTGINADLLTPGIEAV